MRPPSKPFLILNFAFLIPFITFTFLLLTCSYADYADGDGSPEFPFQIAEPNQLIYMSEHPEHWDKHFILTADINMTGFMNFNPIGYYHRIDDQAPFTGVFDGNNFTISNLTYISMENYRFVGLFGFIKSGAEIRNLGLIDLYIMAPNCPSGVGALVGNYGYDATLIINCYVIGGNVTGRSYVGGLIGNCYGGEVHNCYAQTNTEGGDHVGGLCGGAGYASVSNCHTRGTVNGEYSTGGLIGLNYRSEVRKCFSDAYVAGESITGGLVGRNGNDAKIYNCYSAGNVNGLDINGGLVGANWNDMEKALISKCYSSAAVTGNSNSGALIGVQQGGSETLSSFWDVNVNSSLDGISNKPNDPNVIGLSTVEMQTRSHFTDVGWDFIGEEDNGTEDYWQMCIDGYDYPRLTWQFINPADFLRPGRVDNYDLFVLTHDWLTTDSRCCDIAPLPDGDGIVNLFDYLEFSNHWLEE